MTITHTQTVTHSANGHTFNVTVVTSRKLPAWLINALVLLATVAAYVVALNITALAAEVNGWLAVAVLPATVLPLLAWTNRSLN